MGSVLNKNSMRISRNPEFFVSGLIKPGKKTLWIADLSFFDQITGKYKHAASFIKTQLYYLYFPKQIKSLKKNLLINFFIHSHFRICPKINLHFEVSRRSHDKARGGRILNIFSAIVKNISYLNCVENRQDDIFLTKTSYLSQPVLHFQNIAICAVKKLSEISHKNTKVQKHKIRPVNRVDNIFFRDTSFFTYPSLNIISYRSDRNIAEKKSKFTQNLVTSEAIESEKNYISISHPSRRIKSFAKPISIKFFPAVLPFLQMDISNKSNIEHKMFTLPEKDLAFYYTTRLRTHYITPIANLFRYTDVYTRVKYLFKSYFTEFPVTSASMRRKIFNFYDNVINEKQSNISQKTTARPVLLIPFDRTAGLIADLPSLPPVFFNSSLMHENLLLKAKNAGSHSKERAKKQPVESDTVHLNIIKNINFNKKSIKRTKYIPCLNYNFTYMMQQRYMLRKSGSTKVNNNSFSSGGSISPQDPSMAGYRNKFPDMTYFSSNKSSHFTDMAGSAEGKKKTEFFNKVDSSCKTDYTKLLSIPGPDLYGLADKVYGLIVERIKRERELRGR